MHTAREMAERLSVSLFTREWIEIGNKAGRTGKTAESPSLRGSGLKFTYLFKIFALPVSPSLRGSGLKSYIRKLDTKLSDVSLFTREWIEIDSDFG